MEKKGGQNGNDAFFRPEKYEIIKKNCLFLNDMHLLIYTLNISIILKLW